MSTPQSDTPRTAEIIEYLRVQFPATDGHLPLPKMIGALERELEQARLAERLARVQLEEARKERDQARAELVATKRTMTSEAQRIAIAEACGWRDCHSTGGLPCGIEAGEVDHSEVPRYLSDLNAMHEAEKTLNRAQRNVFRGHLGNMFPQDEDGETTSWEGMFGRAISATAAQRAEAFLRAVEK